MEIYHNTIPSRGRAGSFGKSELASDGGDVVGPGKKKKKNVNNW